MSHRDPYEWEYFFVLACAAIAGGFMMACAGWIIFEVMK